MIIHTHSAIGHLLYSHIVESTNLVLDKKHFILGNIKPDINRTLKSIPHRSKDIIDVMECLKNELTTRTHSIDAFSLKLGILCHFLSDTFCRYHFEDHLWERNIVEHVKYEISLHYTFVIASKHSKETVINTSNELFDDFNEAYEHFTKSYIENKKTLLRDTDHALMFSVAVINMINHEILAKECVHVA
ncbi:MAG: zinc dependent phospholipase C family protein [Eubacteriales bacterium]|nr:zinc dependent phospholipase C family protein [Eubacteriales bacterium]